MSLETEFAALMGETITLQAPATVDKYGKRTWSTQQSFTARVQPVQDLSRDALGREVPIMGKVYVYGSPAVTPEWKITLNDGSSPVIVGAYRVRDEDGPHHTMIEIGG